MKTITVVLFAVVVVTVLRTPHAYADYNGAKLVDNTVFLDARSMSAAQIQQFFVSKGAGIASRNFVLDCVSAGSTANQSYQSIGAPCGQSIPASQIIYYVAQIYGVSPRVILATMQKEQSLSTAASPTDWQINQAMGYGCPDSGGCGASNFFYQIDNGAWALRYHYERANSNNTWWNNGSNVCGSATLYRSTGLYAGRTVTFYDDNSVPYVTYTIPNAATDAFYCYTPHAYNNPNGLYGLPAMGSTGMYYSGSYNFVLWFERWFGSTIYLDAGSIINSLPVTIVTQPYATPAVGQTVSYTVSLKNNFSYPITLDNVLIVGRAGSLSAGVNRDFGWQGSVTLTSGASQQFTMTTVVRDTGPVYVWPSIMYQGNFIQYNNWGTTLTGHAPNLTLSEPLLTDIPTVYAGQDVQFTAKLKNNEPYPINYDAIGIPVKFYDRYSYDATWVGPGTLASGAELPLSGTRNIDKPGPFTYWVSNYLSGSYTTIGAIKKFNAAEVTPNFSVSGLTFNNAAPVVGQTLTASFTMTNNLPVPVTVGGVGVVGRLGSVNGQNRDIGWQGSVHFNANETKTFTSAFSTPVTDLGTHYYWIGVFNNGGYIQYNNWGSTVVSRPPSFSVSGLTFNTTSPVIGQSLTASFTITNNLSVPVDVAGIGIVGRLGSIGGQNRDMGWQGPIHFNANEAKTFTGPTIFSQTITDVGTHYYWIGVFNNGGYIQYNNWGSTVVSRGS